MFSDQLLPPSRHVRNCIMSIFFFGSRDFSEWLKTQFNLRAFYENQKIKLTHIQTNGRPEEALIVDEEKP